MPAAGALHSVQYVTDASGQRTGVLLDMETWSALLRWIDDATDTKIAVKALTELHAAGGRPEKAGWVAWEDAAEDWIDEEKSEAKTT